MYSVNYMTTSIFIFGKLGNVFHNEAHYDPSNNANLPTLTLTITVTRRPTL